MSSCTPTAPGQRTKPPGALPARGDDNRVPRTRDQGAVADYRRTVAAERGGGHTWIRPCQGDVYRCVSGWQRIRLPPRLRRPSRTFPWHAPNGAVCALNGDSSEVSPSGGRSAAVHGPDHPDLGAGAFVHRAHLQVVDEAGEQRET